jgi:hypothetical protein
MHNIGCIKQARYKIIRIVPIQIQLPHGDFRVDVICYGGLQGGRGFRLDLVYSWWNTGRTGIE